HQGLSGLRYLTLSPPRRSAFKTIDMAHTVHIIVPPSGSRRLMRHVSYSAFREHLAQYMDEVCDSRAALHVTRQNARTVVLLSADEYEGMLETLHLVRSPANAKRLLRSIHKANAGKLIERDLG